MKHIPCRLQIIVNDCMFSITANKAMKLARRFDILGLDRELQPRMELTLVVRRTTGSDLHVPVQCHIDTLEEVAHYRNGGILNYVLRGIAKSAR